MIEGEISIKGIKFLFGIIVGISFPSMPKREIVEMKKIDENYHVKIIILSLMSKLPLVGETIAYFGLNAIICLIDEEDQKRKDNKRT